MSKPVEDFIAAIKNDNQVLNDLGSATSAKDFGDKAVSAGKAKGFTFTSAEFANYVATKKIAEKTEEQGVAGCTPCPANTRFTTCFLMSCCWGSVC